MPEPAEVYDAVIVGAGVSGSFVAYSLTRAGLRCVLLEAGKSYTRETYPRRELDANAELYWGGGIELDVDASIGLLRPKAVGGGSIVNQALMDRFDDDAFDSWRETSGISFFSRAELDPWYDEVEKTISIRTVPEEYRNGNAEIFRTGFEWNGYRWAPLRRAQADCRFQDGNDCIECLAGCRIDSKQSTAVTVLPRAVEAGLVIVPEFEARRVEELADEVRVGGRGSDGGAREFRGRVGVLACGAVGNSRLLLQSGFGEKLPALGRNFYTHPQYMTLAYYDEPVNAHKGPLQSYKSDDPGFRRSGFKLENVFAPPVAIAMLLPGFGREHHAWMKRIRHFACIEVAIRDTNPGRIGVDGNGRLRIEKRLNEEDRRRRDRGLRAVENIFRATGAKKILRGSFPIGLHLMGGCNMGTDPARSVVGPDFRLHGSKRLYAADSSIFPDAPGINPSFTIMALSLRAAKTIEEACR
ncbi:MAG: GMC family oxidoreductase [Candidatus Binatia bacterium]|nr:MAG: GMC family oxidoreductase [Candidatus Binatia bacterium]